MAISDEQKAELNRMCPAARNVKLGDQIQSGVGSKMAHQAHSVATDATGVVADLNALIDKLIAAGLMASS